MATEGAIAISGLGPLQPGPPMIRAIRAGGWQGGFVGLSYNPLEPTNFQPDMLDASYLLPYPAQGAEHVFGRLAEIHRAHPIAVLIPTLDSELRTMIQLQPRLAQLGIRTLLPTASQLQLRSKARLAELSRATGVAVPRTRVAYGLDAGRAYAAEFTYPFFVKGQFYEAEPVWAPAELDGVLRRMASRWGFPVVLQESIEGVEYDVIGLSGRDGELLGAVPMKKLELSGQGKAWGGVTVADPALDEVVARAMSVLKWRGIFELELIRTKDGVYHLIEINPRVPAWVQLAVAAGQNMPFALVRLALGEAVAPFTEYKVGAMTLRQCVDVDCSMSVFEKLVTAGGVDHAGALDDGWLRRAASPGTRRGP